MKEKVKKITTQDIIVKIFADYANYRDIYWEHTYCDGIDLLDIRLGHKENHTYKEYQFYIGGIEKDNNLLACVNEAIEEYDERFFETGYTPDLPRIEYAHHVKKMEILSKIEDLLLSSDLEWGITCDPKTKGYTICIAEVE